jgi:hypothetical protein
MDELLAEVIDAHGGLDRWSRITGMTARMTIGGPFWAYKGQLRRDLQVGLPQVG